MGVRNYLFSLAFLLSGSVLTLAYNGDVIYAINAGGEKHIDYWGVHYDKDPLTGKVGTASSYGKQLVIGRVPGEDQILYQTERYHHSTFGYDIPIYEDGDYVLVLKFCEVYFNSANKKVTLFFVTYLLHAYVLQTLIVDFFFNFQVFDIVLNGDHTIVSDLDIFERVGRGVAHDEYIPFSVLNDKLYVNGAESDIQGGMIRVEFIKVGCIPFHEHIATFYIFLKCSPKILKVAGINESFQKIFYRATETTLK